MPDILVDASSPTGTDVSPKHPVKWFTSWMEGAPEINNTWGCMVTMLDALLVTGFNHKSVQEIDYDAPSKTATVSIPLGHRFLPEQVILITGADQQEFNGEFRVLSVTANTLKIPIETPPAQNVSNNPSISCKTAPLGFEIAFSRSGERIYRSKKRGSLRKYLKVVDVQPDDYANPNHAKFVRVCIADGFEDIDTPKGAVCPWQPGIQDGGFKNYLINGGKVYGWAKWHYSDDYYFREKGNSTHDSVKKWLFVGDDISFYMFNQGYKSDNNSNRAYRSFGFGDAISHIDGDEYHCFLHANFRLNTSYEPPGNRGGLLNNDADNIQLRTLKCGYAFNNMGYSWLYSPLFCNNQSYWSGGGGNSASSLWKYLQSPIFPQSGIMLTPVYLMGTSFSNTASNLRDGAYIRGLMPGLYHTPMMLNYIMEGEILGDVKGLEDKKFMAVRMGYENANFSIGFIDIYGPWR